MTNNAYNFTETAEDMHAGAAEWEAQQEVARGEATHNQFFADEHDELP